MTDQGQTRNRPPPATSRPSGHHLAVLLMLGAIVGKTLGFIREILMAHLFGASIIADGFRAAITGSLLPLALFQNESVPSILIPTHHGWQEEGDAPRRFAALTVALTMIGIAIMALVEVFGAVWVRALVGGFSPDAQATTLGLIRIMALGMPASVMLNVLASGEIALGRSRLTTIRASLLNLSVIVGLIVIFVTHWVNALAWGFAIAFNGLGAWGLWTLIRDGSLDFRGLASREVVAAAADFWRKLVPFLFVPLADQGNVWMERVLASRAFVGSLASLDYARTITDSAMLFISQPLGLALLSRTATVDDGARLQTVIRRLLVLSAPACVCLAIFAPDIARLVFARGAFTEAAVQMTGETLRGISVGLWASTIGWVILRLLNKAGRNKTAALILVCAYLSNLLFNIVAFRLPMASTHGTLILGLGESIRGLVLLGMTVVCLGLTRSMIVSILLAAIPALGMTILGLHIDRDVSGTLPRLALAGSACGLCILTMTAILMPEFIKVCSRRWRRIFAGPGGSPQGIAIEAAHQKLRVLSIAHPAVLRDVGRLRYYPLARRDDLEVHLLVPERWHQFGRWIDADAPADPGIHVHVLPIWFPRAPLMSWYLHIYPGLRSVINEVRPDVIHLWEEPWSLVALQACLMRGPASLVLEVDQNILKRLVFPFEWIRRFVLRRADYILPRSHDAEQVVRARGYAGPASLIEYGVDESTFHPVRNAVPARPSGMLKLGYVGRIVVEKGLDDAIEALVMTPPDVTLAIMGEGPYEAPVRRRIAELGLSTRVSFSGWGGPCEVADFIRSQDVILLLTRTSQSVREQFGRIIIEAQSCGVPVIGSDCGAIPDVIGKGGWIVPEGDPAALAECIRAILADPSELGRRAEAGQANVKRRYTYGVIARKLADAWYAAAGRHAATTGCGPASVSLRRPRPL